MLTREAGFSLTELLVVIAIVTALTALAAVNLVRPQTRGELVGVVQTLVADLKNQQTKAMAGDAGSGTAPVAQGVRITTGNYTLFKGSSYSAGDADNLVIDPDATISLSTTFPSGDVIFTQRSGDVSGWTAGTSTITVTNTVTSDVKTITINRYGAITVN
jgi:prepilin-type N-terminal cleavage/methylation domain-containing protein